MLLVFIAIIFALFVTRFYLRLKNYPPGPLPLPIIGNLFLLYHFPFAHELFDQLKAKYGGIFTIWIASKPYVVINDYDNCREAYDQLNHFLAARPTLANMDELEINRDPNLIFRPSDMHWFVHRKLALSMGRKTSSSESTASRIGKLVDDVASEMTLEPSKAYSISEMVPRLVTSLVATEVYGTNYEIYDETLDKLMFIVKIQSESSALFIPMSAMPLLKYLLWPTYKKFVSATTMAEEIMGQAMKSRKKHFTFDCEPMCILDHFIEASKNSDIEQFLTDFNIISTVWSMFLGAIHATKDTLNWTLLFLCKYPDIQLKVKSEILSALSNSEKNVTLDLLHECPYTHAVISEVLRCKPNSPFGIPKATVNDVTICNRFIPQGTGILLSILSPHMSEQAWNDPHLFKPERFLDQQGHFTTRTGVKSPYRPFSTGKRMCVGEKVAKANLFLILSHFIQRTKHFVWTLADKDVSLQPEVKRAPFISPASFDVILVPDEQFTLQPSGPQFCS